MRREKEGPSWVHLDSKIRRFKSMNLLVKCAIKVADGKVVMFHCLVIAYPSSSFLMSVKSPMDPQLAAKRSVCFNWLSRWLTNKVIIRRWMNCSNRALFGGQATHWDSIFFLRLPNGQYGPVSRMFQPKTRHCTGPFNWGGAHCAGEKVKRKTGPFLQKSH